MTEHEERDRGELVVAAKPDRPWDQLSEAEQEDFARAVYRQIAEGVAKSRARHQAAGVRREDGHEPEA